ncbi:MAG: hypothetical protein PHC66_03225 [Candidatus Nanoarchaeia archaeon]|nr:hypothetical protein [Candidatus Nanoarchaeia archaeon]MDD5239446.1 hypothetical protein [Candidatus Nanoarchaeia archaeon]
MRYSLSRKCQIEFIFSKFAFLVFGIIITGSFFYFLAIQKDIQAVDELARTAEAAANVIGMASASPFHFSMLYEPEINATLFFNNSSFDINSNNRTLTHPLYFPIKTNGTVQMNGCINITKTNVTEVFACP